MIGIAALQRVDQLQMFGYGDLIADPFAALVPLVMVVKDQRDDAVKIGDEAVRPGGGDQAVKAVVQFGKHLIPCVEIGQQSLMFRFQRLKVGPERRAVGLFQKMPDRRPRQPVR